MNNLPFEIEDEFRNALALHRLYPDNLIGDGTMQRFAVAEDAEHESSGWYVLSSERRTSTFGNSRTGFFDSWISFQHQESSNSQKSRTISNRKKQSNENLEVNDREVLLQRCSEIVPEPISWLWKHWIAEGKLTILGGDVGVSKSTLSLSLAATISNGGSWPDGTPCKKKGNVLIWSSEDTASNTIVPRLIAAGANLDRCLHVKGIRNAGEKKPFDPSQDMLKLQHTIRSYGKVDLLIIDPIVSVVSGDMNKSNEVRRSLQPILDFAEEHNCAVIGISHLSKGSAGKRLIDRLLGSQGFSAVPRVVLFAAKDEEGARRILIRGKSNIGPENDGFEYSVVETGFCSPKKSAVTEPIETSYINWGKFRKGTAQQLIDEIDFAKDSRRNSDTELKEFIAGKIINAGGKIPSNDIMNEIKAAGYSFDRAKKFKEKFGFESYKDGKNEWYWKMTPSDNPM